MQRLAVLALTLAVLTGCSDVCSNTVVQQVNAPNGQHSAVMYQRDCDATTGFSTQISLVARADQPDGGENTFRADDDHGAASVGHWGGPWAEMRWLAPDHLLVRYADKSRIFEQDEHVSGVQISYQAVSR